MVWHQGGKRGVNSGVHPPRSSVLSNDSLCVCVRVYTPCVCVGVSKVVTVEVKGSWQRWLKVQDLTRGVTYAFSVQARTVALGPPLHANISAQPLQGRSSAVGVCVCVCGCVCVCMGVGVCGIGC